jgi:integrase
MGAFAGSVLQSVKLTTASDTETTAFLFPARGGSGNCFNGWSKGKAQLDKKIVDILSPDINQKPISFTPWTLHDLRRTYATNLQRLGIKLEVIEALLNHVSGTRAGIVGVYQRHAYETEMREAVTTFDAWFSANILPNEEP